MNEILIAAIPILLAVSLHESAHGLVAYWLGDDTAKSLGRLTANPLKHIDLIGTIIVPVVMLLLISVPFGWAKPVPVNPSKFENPLKDMALVALAGPAANFLMAIFWAMVMTISVHLLSYGALKTMLMAMASWGVGINLVLMVLNLLPLPPLDGGRIITGVMPLSAARYFIRFERIGILLVILLIASGFLGKILPPMVESLQQQFYLFFGIA